MKHLKKIRLPPRRPPRDTLRLVRTQAAALHRQEPVRLCLGGGNSFPMCPAILVSKKNRQICSSLTITACLSLCTTDPPVECCCTSLPLAPAAAALTALCRVQTVKDGVKKAADVQADAADYVREKAHEEL